LWKFSKMPKKRQSPIEEKELTPWEKLIKINKDKTVYTVYQIALQDGIQPDIPPPPKPTARRTREEIALTPTKSMWEKMTQEERDAFLELKKTWRKH